MKNPRFPSLIVSLIAIVALVVPVVVFAKSIELPVPSVMQVSDGNWAAPWDEACEEAVTVMIDAYYTKQKNIPVEEANRRMQAIIDWENKVFQKYQDTDAEETLRMIGENASFRASIERNPTLDGIKRELAKGRPAIILVDMYALYREPPLGDSYHVVVLTGYDDGAQEFLMNDPGREARRYPYDVVMGALHDFNPETQEADGTPTVLFTAPPRFSFQEFLQRILATVRGWFRPTMLPSPTSH